MTISPEQKQMVLGMEKRTSELIRANECQQFAQLSATIKDLSGNEGRTQLLNYFANLETITDGWTNFRRAQLISTHLVSAFLQMLLPLIITRK